MSGLPWSECFEQMTTWKRRESHNGRWQKVNWRTNSLYSSINPLNNNLYLDFNYIDSTFAQSSIIEWIAFIFSTPQSNKGILAFELDIWIISNLTSIFQRANLAYMQERYVSSRCFLFRNITDYILTALTKLFFQIMPQQTQVSILHFILNYIKTDLAESCSIHATSAQYHSIF